MNSHEVFIHFHQGCFAGTGAIVRLPQCQWSKPDGYGKISQCITTTKHSKAKTVCIFLGIYCIIWNTLMRYHLEYVVLMILTIILSGNGLDTYFHHGCRVLNRNMKHTLNWLLAKACVGTLCLLDLQCITGVFNIRIFIEEFPWVLFYNNYTIYQNYTIIRYFLFSLVRMSAIKLIAYRPKEIFAVCKDRILLNIRGGVLFVLSPKLNINKEELSQT